MPVVIDASVAIKWVLEEDGSAAARDLAASETMMAPELLFLECANVLAMKVRRGLLSVADADEAMAAIQDMGMRSAPSGPHRAMALRIAIALGQTVYDSLYLALALAERVSLVTADARFAAAAAREPVYAERIRLLTPGSGT
ncbi:MAG TPA: type II toxin-antitoxin system VapC family toxin [Caulobacteraceae bacterium]|nr:type II toxin-antitoxin system VapC family toxin [Caulobacteraceae bacterium]